MFPVTDNNSSFNNVLNSSVAPYGRQGAINGQVAGWLRLSRFTEWWKVPMRNAPGLRQVEIFDISTEQSSLASVLSQYEGEERHGECASTD